MLYERILGPDQLNRGANVQRRGQQIFITLLIVALAISGCRRPPNPEAAEQATIAFKRFAAVGESADDFPRIFRNRKATAARVRDFTNARPTAQTKGFTLLIRSENESNIAETFLAQYRQAASGQIFTLVGHNEGGIFRFRDGSWLNLNLIGQNDTDKLIAVISCESGRFVQGQAVGVPSDTTYNIAFSTEERFRQHVQEAVAAGVVIDATRARQELTRSFNEIKTERQVRIYSYSIGSGGVVGLAIFEAA
jgi:hypothetical protein